MKRQCKVGESVFRNYLFLQNLAKTSSQKKINLFLQSATPDELSTLVNICYNITHSNFKLTPCRLRKLKKFACPIRKLAEARTIGKAKKVLQHGKGFPFASLLIPILIEASRAFLNHE